MKPRAFALVAPAVLLSFGGLPARGQSVISAQSGLIHFTEGQVFVQNKAIRGERGVFPLVAENQTLRTNDGKAEVLLNPGVFLRVGGNSSFRMVSTRLTASKVELISGEVVIEAMETNKNSTVTLTSGDVTVTITKRGVYRLSTDPPALRVFEGQAVVQTGSRQIRVGKGRLLAFGEPWVARKFNVKDTDDLDTWSWYRAAIIARANIPAARTLRSYGNTWIASGWAWDPYDLTFVFVPFRNSFRSCYGYWYSSPRTVDQFTTGSGGQAQPRESARSYPDRGDRGDRAMSYSGGESAVSSAPAPAVTHTSSSSSSSAPPPPPQVPAERSLPDRGPR